VQEFYKCFRRDGLGAWTCIAPAELSLPAGRIQVTPMTRFIRGTRFMGVDIAQMLDDEHQQQGES
jgi:hypothetical protein